MLINFNQQFRLKTNELNIIFNNFSSSGEIYLLIKIGSKIGALTISVIFYLVGVYYAKYEGLNTLKSGFAIKQNETPTYEMLSGAAIAFAALLL